MAYFFQKTAADQVAELIKYNEMRKSEPEKYGLYNDTAVNLPVLNAITQVAALTNGKNGINNSAKAAAHGAVKDLYEAIVDPASSAISSGISSSKQVSKMQSSPTVVDLAKAPITSATSGIENPEIRANAFNEMMVNSAHQREVQDLIAAGLNPVLSAKYGGSSSPDAVIVNGASDGSSGYAGSAQKGFTLPLIRNPSRPWQLAYNVIAQNSDNVFQSAKQVIRTVSQNK